MAAKGAVSKSEVMDKIKQSFEGAFYFNGGKEIRIPMTENGEVVQIKITATAAKVSVDAADESFGTTPVAKTQEDGFPEVPVKAEIIGMTAEESSTVEDLLNELGL